MVLVVGATGLVGSEVCRKLAQRSESVRALVRATSSTEKVAARMGRVLGWSDPDAMGDGAPADVVIGQPNFEAWGCNGVAATFGTTPPATASTLCDPSGLAVPRAGPRAMPRMVAAGIARAAVTVSAWTIGSYGANSRRSQRRLSPFRRSRFRSPFTEWFG